MPAPDPWPLLRRLPGNLPAAWFGGVVLCCALLLTVGAVLPARAAGVPVAGSEEVPPAALEILADGRLAGSGSFVAVSGLALTAAHTVRGARQIEVLSPFVGRHDARVVATDLGHDLVLLQVQRREGPFPALPLADEAPPVGTRLQLYGSALFRHGLRLPGTVAKTAPLFEWNSVNRCYTEVQAVAAMTPEGLSGGPWVDDAGRLAGVQSGVAARQGNPVGIAFMSPLPAVRRLVDSRQGTAAATLGGQFAELWEWAPEGRRRGAQPDGLYLLDPLPGGPLAAAGIGRGELITAVDGVPVRYRDQLLAAVRRLLPGDRVTLEIVSPAGTPRTVSLRLAECGAF